MSGLWQRAKRLVTAVSMQQKLSKLQAELNVSVLRLLHLAGLEVCRLLHTGPGLH